MSIYKSENPNITIQPLCSMLNNKKFAGSNSISELKIYA